MPFLKTTEELSTYAGAIYSATKWGIKIEEINMAIPNMDKSVKKQGAADARLTTTSIHDYSANTLLILKVIAIWKLILIK